jgi:hypothetical protein
MSVQPHRVNYQQDLGGDKTDYMPPVNPTTDRSAQNVNDSLASIAGAVATQSLAVIQLAATSTAANITNKYLSFQDNGLWSVSRSGVGIYVLKLYTAVYDVRNNPLIYTPQFAIVSNNSQLLSSYSFASGSDGSGNYYTVTTTFVNYLNAAVDPTQVIIQLY